MYTDIQECIVRKLYRETGINCDSIDEHLSKLTEKITDTKLENSGGKLNSQIRRLEFLRNEASIVFGLGPWKWHG